METTSDLRQKKERAYYRRRLQNRIFEAISSFYKEESEKRDLYKKDLAEKMGKDPAQLTRWLAYPSNLTIETISDLLYVLDAEPDINIVRFQDRLKANDMHPMAARIENMEIHRHQNRPLNSTTSSSSTNAKLKYNSINPHIMDFKNV